MDDVHNLHFAKISNETVVDTIVSRVAGVELQPDPEELKAYIHEAKPDVDEMLRKFEEASCYIEPNTV